MYCFLDYKISNEELNNIINLKLILGDDFLWER